VHLASQISAAGAAIGRSRRVKPCGFPAGEEQPVGRQVEPDRHVGLGHTAVSGQRSGNFVAEKKTPQNNARIRSKVAAAEGHQGRSVGKCPEVSQTLAGSSLS